MLCDTCREEVKKESIDIFESQKNEDEELAEDMEISICHDELYMEVPYILKDGRQYWKSYTVDINYCCRCGHWIEK